MKKIDLVFISFLLLLAGCNRMETDDSEVKSADNMEIENAKRAIEDVILPLFIIRSMAAKFCRF